MFRQFSRAVLVLSLYFCSMGVFGQYDDVAHDQNLINLGVAGINDDTNISATVVAPINRGNVNGWLGLYGQQQTVEGAISSQLLNAHIQVGYDLGFVINAFADWTKDRQRGISGQTQIGGFAAADLYETDEIQVTGGAGNFLENKRVRGDLELKDTDPNVSRWLLYALAKYRRYSLLSKVTPKADFGDFQISLEPIAAYSLSDALSLIVRAKLGYETAPVAAGEEFHASYQLQLGATF